MYNFGMQNQGMYGQSYNPYENQRFQPQMQTNNALVRVTGIEGAKAFQMPANSTVALFDNNEDFFYVKTTDGAGFPTIRTFKFEEVNQDLNKVNQDLNKNYVSREEMEEYVQQFIQQSKSSKQSSSKQSNDEPTS